MQYENTAQDSAVIREMAIKKVFANLQRTLSLLHHGLICNEKDANEVITPQNIFSWSKEDLVARLKLENMAWLDLFTINLPESYMGMRKLEIDIKELMEFTILLFEKFQNHDTKIAKKLQSALRLLDFPEFMQKQLNWNAHKAKELFSRMHSKEFGTQLLQQTTTKLNALEQLLSENNVYEPIQTRYQIRYNKSLGDQFEDGCLVEQNKIIKEIDRYNELMCIEEYCSQCTVNALYTETNNYKTRLYDLDVQYAKEYEAINNQLIYRRAKFERMRVQRSYLEEEILRFREEIDDVLRLNQKKTRKRSKKRQGNTERTLLLGNMKEE